MAVDGCHDALHEYLVGIFCLDCLQLVVLQLLAVIGVVELLAEENEVADALLQDLDIEIHPFLEFDGTLVAKLSKSETDYISIGLFPNASQEQYCLDKMYTVKFQVNSDKINIKELQYYCEKTAKAYTTCKMKSNEEKFQVATISPMLCVTLQRVVSKLYQNHICVTKHIPKEYRSLCGRTVQFNPEMYILQ